MYAILSYWDQKYQPLADLTWDLSKVPYADTHGYTCLMQKIEDTNSHALQRQKVNFIRQALRENFEWIWWTGSDLLITNWRIKIEEKIDNDFHMIITTDCNGINADSILIRNSKEMLDYWDLVDSILPSLHNHWEGEQKIIKDTYPNYKNKIKVVPQREMNSYDYNIYQGFFPPYDYLGTDGNWQRGDWVIQWPGVPLETRLMLANHYINMVMR